MIDDLGRYILDNPLFGIPPLRAEGILLDCIKELRSRRYSNRAHDYAEEWLPVVRVGYSHYLVSNWGRVRQVNKSEEDNLSPDFALAYPRVVLSSPVHGQSQHLIHLLVAESFVLKQPLPNTYWRTRKTGDVIINHRDLDKWNPSLGNLEITDLSGNAKHWHQSPRA